MKKAIYVKRVEKTFVLWIVVSTLFMHYAAAATETLPYPKESSIRLGDGYDMIQLKAHSDGCFVSNEGDLEDTNVGEVHKFGKMVTNSHHFLQSYNTAFNASYEGFGFNLSGGLEFATTNELNINEIIILATIKVEMQGSRLRNFELKPEAKEMLAQGNFVGFHEVYGHKYIKAIRNGGFLTIAIKIHTRDESHKNEIKEIFRGKGITPVGTFGLKQQFTSIMDNEEIKQYSSFQQDSLGPISYGNDNNLQSWDDALNLISEFQQKIADTGGYPMSMELGDYTNLSDYNEYTDGSSSCLDPEQYKTLSDYYLQYFHYQTLHRNLTEMTDHHEKYYFHSAAFTKNELYNQSLLITDMLNEMKERMEDYQGYRSTLYEGWDTKYPSVDNNGNLQSYRDYMQGLLWWPENDKILPLRWYTPLENPYTLKPLSSPEKFYFNKTLRGDGEIWQTTTDRIVDVFVSCNYDKNSGNIKASVNAWLWELAAFTDYTVLKAEGNYTAYKLPEYTYAEFIPFLLNPVVAGYPYRVLASPDLINFRWLNPVHGYLNFTDNDHSQEPAENTTHGSNSMGNISDVTYDTGSDGLESQHAYISKINLKPVEVLLFNEETEWDTAKISRELCYRFNVPSTPSNSLPLPSETKGWENLK